MEEYGNYISVALLPLLAILQPHRWKIFPDQYINIEMGLETITEDIQFNILNKCIPLNELIETINQIHSVNMFVSLNVLVGIPFLSEKEQFADALKTLQWALANNADYVVLFPINIQPYSLFEWWYTNKYISIPSLWMLVCLLLKLSDEELKHVCFAWYGNRCITYSEERHTQIPQACSLCQPQLICFFEKFSNDFNLENRKMYIKQLLEVNFQCDCFKKISASIENDVTIKYSNWEKGHRAIEEWMNEYAINGCDL